MNALHCYKLKVLSVILLLWSGPLRSQPIPIYPSDSTALVEFYWATNGPNWTNNFNWLTGPVGLWCGITVDYKDSVLYVRDIHLPNNNLNGVISPLLCNMYMLMGLGLEGNNLTGQIPEWIGDSLPIVGLELSNNHLTNPLPMSLGNYNQNNLGVLSINNNDFSGQFPDTILKNPHLYRLFISGNKFDEFPYVSSMNIPNFALMIDNNCFTFEDILPYMQAFFITYSPQDSVLESIDTTVMQGSTLVLDSWVDTCSANMYRWKKDGVFLTSIPVASSQLVLNNIHFSDSGYYSCDVTNLGVWTLFLHRRQIHVHVVDSVNAVGTTVSPQEVDIQYNNADGLLNIRMNFSSAGQVECYLYDITGRQVMRLYKGSARQQELHYYPAQIVKAGVYIVRLKGQDLSLAKRILVR